MTLRWESETLSPGGPGASTAADARRWLALASGTGAYAYASLTSGTAVLAMAIPILTVLGLSPILRRRDDWLLETASTVAHNNIDVLAVLGKLIELRDPETNGHTLRVTLYTAMFAEALGLPPKAVVRAVKGAMLHDIGKTW